MAGARNAAKDGAGVWVPQLSRQNWWQRLWAPFWAIPLAFGLASILVGVGLPAAELGVLPQGPMLFPGGASGARSVLSTIATAMISLTGLVFSITIVVLQLASSQFTPRVLGAFLDSRITQITLGVFAGTFLYSLTVLRSVRDPSEGNPGFVPQLATGGAYISVLVSFAFFLAFIHHITSSIQVTQIIRRTALATLKTLDRMIPLEQDEAASPGESCCDTPSQEMRVVLRNSGGNRYLTDINYRQIVEHARKENVVVMITSQLGDFVPAQAIMGEIWLDSTTMDRHEELADTFGAMITLDTERSLRQDVSFGIRQLVDIGERALSPGVNDPTTAVEVIDALHGLLRPMVQRSMPSSRIADIDGNVRLLYSPQTIDQHLNLAVREIAHWGKDSLQVPKRLIAMLEDLHQFCLPQYGDTVRALQHLVEHGQDA